MQNVRPALSVSGISKSFRRQGWPPWAGINNVLRGVSFSAEAGSLVGLVGENGSGKSVLMRIIVGLMKADEGSVSMSGQLGYCPQVPLLYDKLSCDETFRLFGHAYGMDDRRTEDRAAYFYEFFNFARYHGELVEILSGGTKQKLNLSIALLHQPHLLILDEPYSGFDWDTYQKFWELAKALRSSGTTILIVSHFIEEQSHFNRVLRLRDGLIEEDSA